jgi:predicted secreted Zn-dependent protease
MDLIVHRATKKRECELTDSADGSIARRAHSPVAIGHGSRHVGLTECAFSWKFTEAERDGASFGKGRTDLKPTVTRMLG